MLLDYPNKTGRETDVQSHFAKETVTHVTSNLDNWCEPLPYRKRYLWLWNSMVNFHFITLSYSHWTIHWSILLLWSINWKVLKAPLISDRDPTQRARSSFSKLLLYILHLIYHFSQNEKVRGWNWKTSFCCCDFCKACGASNLTEMTIQMISITRQYFPCIRLFWKLDFVQF